MAGKKLAKDSKYAQYDTDGDGIVTDDEMAQAERMIEIENKDKKEDQLRQMAWVAMLSSILTVAALLTPLIGIERMNTASGFLNTFLVAQTGIVVGFMGMTAWAKSKD